MFHVIAGVNSSRIAKPSWLHIASGLSTAERKLRCDMRWKQLRGARLKAVAQPADNAKRIDEKKVQIVERDPVHAQLYQWEIEYQKRRMARANDHDGGNGHAR
jgi:hypothetical protein